MPVLAFAFHRIFKLSISFSNMLSPSMVSHRCLFLSLYYFWQQEDFFSPLPTDLYLFPANSWLDDKS